MGLGYDSENVFAKILRGTIEAAVVLETKNELVFMDAFPEALGHCLVIPKMHCINIFDTPRDVLLSLVLCVQELAKAVRDTFPDAGVIVKQFNGRQAGQTVLHTHFHVIPVNDCLQLKKEHASGEAVPLADLLVVAKQIRLHVNIANISLL